MYRFSTIVLRTQVLESKRNAIRKGLVYELLNVQDTVLCSYLAQRSGERSDCQNLGGAADEADEVLQGLDNFACGLHEGNETEKE